MQQIITPAGGTYTFFVPTYGTYEVKVDTTFIPFTTSCPVGGIHTSIISAVDSIDSNADFAMICKTDYDVAVNSIASDSGMIRPGRKALLKIHAGDMANFYGANCIGEIPGQLQITINGPAHYIGYAMGSLPPSTVISNIITWNIADFSVLNFFNDFHIRIMTDTTALIGQTVCVNAIITSNPADFLQTNNQLSECFQISLAFDPNEKEVSPIEGLTYPYDDFLTYTIHFQNTGTATADHIQIIDTLDSDLDFLTFQLLDYSHPNMTQVLEGGIVHFNFPNINLPDSNSNEPASHGYIQYKIKPKSNTPLTATFDNTASIYFDFNSPVVTNTTHTSFATGINAISNNSIPFSLYPNPTSKNITVDYNITVTATLTIYNLLGEQVQQISLEKNTTKKTVTLTNIPSGIYFCVLRTEDGKIAQQKLVVVK
ncbi:MAG: T9SS type A sorting domain-containing protein [Bacteroidota bacterium]